MDTLQELLDIENRGWQALMSEAHVARAFYADLLAEDAVMLLPGGLALRGRESILSSLGAQPWEKYEIQDAQVVPLGGAAAVLAYRVAARHSGAEEYKAYVSSVYSKHGGAWRLAFHQQTPT